MDRNNEVVLRDIEGHHHKAVCIGGISLVMHNAAYPGRYRTNDQPPHHSFTLKDSNGEAIGMSEVYVSPGNRDHGMENVRSEAPTAKTVDRS